MAVKIFIHESVGGLTDQTHRLRLMGSNSQVFSLTRGQTGTGSFEFIIAAGDTYVPTQGSEIIIHEIVNAVDTIVFRGLIAHVDRTWKDMGETGWHSLTVSVATLHQALDIPIFPYGPDFFPVGTPSGTVFSDLFATLPAGTPLTLGTVQAGADLLSDLVIRWTDTYLSVFQQLATLSSYIFDIKMSDGTVYFQAQTTTAAPFTLTNWLADNNDDYLVDGTNYRNQQTITISFDAFIPDVDVIPNGGGGNQTQFLRFRMESVQQAFLTDAVQATVTGIFTGVPSNGDTVTILPPGQTADPYTWVTTLDNTVRNQVKIGATAAACAQNLCDAINAQPNVQGVRSPFGVNYSMPTWYNQTCQSDQPGTTPAGSPPSPVPSIVLRVSLPGVGGNGVAVSATGTAFSWQSSTCTGGAGDPGNYTELQVGLYSSGAGAGQPGGDVQYTVGGSAIFLKAGIIQSMSLLVTYYRLGANTIVLQDSAAVASRATIESGSGLHSANVTDTNQGDPYVAYQMAKAYLTAYETVPTQLKFTTLQPLLSPGQLITVSIVNPPDAPAVINGNYLVQSVVAAYIAGMSEMPEPYGHFVYTVTIISVPEIQTFLDYHRQPFKLSFPTPPPALSAANPPTSTPSLKPTTQANPGSGAPQQGQQMLTAGQSLVQEQLGLYIENSSDDLVMVTGSTVSSASYVFQSGSFPAGDVGKYVVIADGTAGWTAGSYPITSVTAGVATITGSPASSGSTGGPWGIGTPGVYVFSWVPATSQYTKNQQAWVKRQISNGDSPRTNTTRVLTPFTYAEIGYKLPGSFDNAKGPDYMISGNKLTLRDIPGATDFIETEYFPAGPSPTPRKAGDPPPPVFVVAVNSNAGHAVMSSPDAVTWTLQTTSFDNGSAVTFAGGKYVMGLEGSTPSIATSSNGLSWTTHSSPADGNFVKQIVFAQSQYVALWGFGATVHIMTSPDGATWTAQTVPTVGNSIDCIAYSPDLGLWVGLGGGGNFITSPDAVTWTVRSSGVVLSAVSAVAWGNSTFVAVGGSFASGTAWTSSDGLTWTSHLSPGGYVDNWDGILFAGGKFVAVGDVGSSAPKTGVTTNGTSWSLGTPADTSTDWEGIAFGTGLYVACGYLPTGTHMIMTSTDGLSWTLQTTPSVDSLEAICFGG